jgi:hypothetical protein
MRWLALVAATRLQKEKYPHAFRVPQCIRSKEKNKEGTTLYKPRQVIGDTLNDGDEVIVELRQGASIPEDVEEDVRDWFDEAYGPTSPLMDCKFRWKNTPGITPPAFVRGEYHVNPRWVGVFPNEIYGGSFEIPLDIIDTGDADNPFDFVASRKGPPGMCSFRFLSEGGEEMVCKAMSETIDERDKTRHLVQFDWDVPVAPEPNPEIDSRPSTASSRDGAQVDPRFEQDWEAMRLRWVENYMKVRVKDVLTEFYAILIDLFDSYAFMGLDLSSSQHTIGMDDFMHLVLSCGLSAGQPEGSLPWREICAWYEEAAGVKDGRPYLGQRLTRAHFLELLMRTAGWNMCEHPRPKYAPGPGQQCMPLDEGLFRFITDILIPVMDVFDDDVIRKDAVQNQNLIVIQQNRPSIRSIYSFIGQPWPPNDKEPVVIPATLSWIFEFAKEKLEEGAAAAPAAAADGGEKKEGEEPAAASNFLAELEGEDKLTVEQLFQVITCLETSVVKVTDHHPELPEERALLFWEFFEVLMHLSRDLGEVHETMPLIVETCKAVMQLVDQGEAQLPEPPSLAAEGEAEPE